MSAESPAQYHKPECTKPDGTCDCKDPSELSPAPDSAASSKYFVRWLPEGGGKAVAVGNWKEVMEAARMLMDLGPGNLEIGEVVEMPPNDEVRHGGPDGLK